MSVKTSISWADCCINPISGCLNGCDFCYARRFAYRLRGRFGYPKDEPFRPTFHPDKLQDIYNLCGARKRVFLDSMGDWFSPDVKNLWIRKILKAIEKKPDHTFLVLTKNPDRIFLSMNGQKLLKNLWIGTSITNQTDVWRLQNLKDMWPGNKFVSFEPLHGPIQADLSGIEWVIIGAETGNRKSKTEAKREWIWDLCVEADCLDIPVFLKDNLRPFILEEPRQEFPEVMLP